MLLSAERLSVQEVARQAGVSRPAVWRWQQRYGEEGVEGLLRDFIAAYNFGRRLETLKGLTP